ncbi:hypothetical protein HUW51_13330 [Adhaeribacter swui]|uniref:DUF4177 domain-containing protein n=1 Tax=Adhaeribacter swui TaxID=2086471 RepID=A0A7G7G922_9BACT|nr:hypothetical protein [Adhaeribacter swui]QNF33656.1 hypothetical protein HUW51_13330 [Adhaeribacter swui]
MATNRGKDKLVNFSVSVDASTSRRQRLIKSEEMYDYSGVLKIVKEYQDRGWEMKSSNMATSNPQEFFLYFLLEK